MVVGEQAVDGDTLSGSQYCLCHQQASITASDKGFIFLGGPQLKRKSWQIEGFKGFLKGSK